jgi:hypothetical protein
MQLLYTLTLTHVYFFWELMPNKCHKRSQISPPGFISLAMTSDPINTLLAWCSANRIQIDPRLRIIRHTDHAGVGVFCHDAEIGCPSTREFIFHVPVSMRARARIVSQKYLIIAVHSCLPVVRIPKSAVLSVKSCSLSDSITPEPYGHEAHLALSLALYGEM